jgi:hypothetical protein
MCLARGIELILRLIDLHHAEMAICEVDQAHFGGYVKGKPLFYQHVKRDGFTDILEESLNKFRNQYEEQFWEITSAMEKISGNEKLSD